MRKPIRYVSTNRDLRDVEGIRPFTDRVSFREALLLGQAPDEGLFMPDRIPVLPPDAIRAFRGRPYREVALFVSLAFLENEIGREDLRRIVDDSYDFPVPLERAGEGTYLMRLDRGPTASFKDFAARMMARLMGHFRGTDTRLNVLVATSGDTGSAVGDAFRGVEGIDVRILYPRNEVSGRQKKQLDTIGGNVQALSIDGKFDDCQNLVKRAFADPAFERFHLTSANSINFGRILPQMIYYVYAYAELCGKDGRIVFSVPSGNFGDALGCEYARRMGLPVRRLIMATNENDEFPRFLDSGVYEKVSPSRACLSNAMNVGHPSNLARFFDLYGGTVDRTGKVFRYPDREEMRKHIFSVAVTDGETKETLREVYRRLGVLLEPHGAVGWKGLDAFLEKESLGRDTAVVLETAHPAKFPAEIVELLGITPELPESLKDLDERSGEPVELPADYPLIREYLLDTLQTR